MPHAARFAVFALATWASALAGCSFDEKANPAFGCDGCKDRGGECQLGLFCVITDGGSADVDGGTKDDAGARDAAMGADAAAADGGNAGGSGGTGSGGTGGGDPAPGDPCDTEDEQEYCYSAAKSTVGKGPCKVGIMTCQAGGKWSACEGEVVPIGESCNNADDDCDGNTDEALTLGSCEVIGQLPGTPCSQSTWVCNGGVELCEQVTFTAAESCNAVDDDCDGSADEGTAVACYSPGTAAGSGCADDGAGGYDCDGICKSGLRECVDGELEAGCRDEVIPDVLGEQATIIGGAARDEDCDGTVDEEFPCTLGETYKCYTGPQKNRGVGVCVEGDQGCMGQAFGPCIGDVLPGVETCANIGEDNDCDGSDVVVEVGTSCTAASAGVCANGTYACDTGALVCTPGSPIVETCNELDDDCDGPTDETFALNTDENNCGSCGRRCGAGLTCCGGECVNTTNDEGHCGGCGTTCTGATNECCSSGCVNTKTNKKHCGGCGDACLLVCSNGNCPLL